MGKSKNYGMNTKAIHTEKRVKLPTGDVMPPIHLSTTFENSQPGEYEYFNLNEINDLPKPILIENFLKENLY